MIPTRSSLVKSQSDPSPVQPGNGEGLASNTAENPANLQPVRLGIGPEIKLKKTETAINIGDPRQYSTAGNG